MNDEIGNLMSRTANEIEGGDQQQAENNNKNESVIAIYEEIMEKFCEMDTKMVDNDKEKYEALQQKDFWFSKSQMLEKDLENARSQMKSIQERCDQAEGDLLQLSKTATKKGNLNNNIMNSTQNKTKRKPNKNNRDPSDIEEDSNSTPIPET